MNLLSTLCNLGRQCLPPVQGRIERRILVNVRVRPELVARILPAPLQPRVVKGWSLAGVCLLRLGDTRPRGWPAGWGMKSENAAHRFAVQWLDDGSIRDGFYIPDRATDSRLNHAFGSLLPGELHLADFQVWESPGRWRIGWRRRDGGASLKLVARTVNEWPPGSVLESADQAASFHRAGPIGWSPRADGVLEGLEFNCDRWTVEPLLVERFESSYFQDVRRFPAGSVEFDSACLMRDVEHELKGAGLLQPRTEPIRERTLSNLVPARHGEG